MRVRFASILNLTEYDRIFKLQQEPTAAPGEYQPNAPFQRAEASPHFNQNRFKLSLVRSPTTP